MTQTPEQGLFWPAPKASQPGEGVKVVGIDENGLGPKLGPLVVTGCALETGGKEYDRERIWKAFEGVGGEGSRVRIGDSKEVSGFQDMAKAEILIHALARTVSEGPFSTADGFLRWIGLNPFESLCPAPSHAPCFTRDWPLPLFAEPEGFADRVEELARELGTCFSNAGIPLLSLRSTIYCPFRYNAFFAHAPEAKKSSLNFTAFEEVIRHFSEQFGEMALYLCGKVMNLKYYGKYFAFLSAFDVLWREETHLISQYRLAGLGDVRFIHDGDRLDLPISLASIAGKYVREIYVFRVNRFFQDAFPGLKPASGYNDRVTKRLIEKVKPRLSGLSVDPSCFLRVK
jgi:hypothetical protein